MTHPNGVHQQQIKWLKLGKYVKNPTKNQILSSIELHSISCHFCQDGNV
jgi:hypothetical protein